jgi:DNA-directed RNA polymerase specialized sigma24 family protein
VDHLDFEKIVRLLSDQARTVLALRNAGYEWSEIGQLLNVSVVTIKGSFWREIVQIREKLKSAGVSRKAR